MSAPRNLLVLITALLLLFVSACGAAPDTAPIPSFPGAEEVSGNESNMAAAIQKGLEQQQAQQGLDTTSTVYRLPEETTFQNVEQFYQGELSGRGWTQQENIPATPGVSVAGWSRGSDQAFVVAVIQDPMSGDNLLMTMQATR